MSAMAFLLFAPPCVYGQQVVGTVRDAESGAPLASVTVELLALDGAVRAQALSSASGTFTMNVPEPTSYHLRAWRIGLDTLLHGPIDLVADTTVRVEVLLAARAIAVDGVSVEVARSIEFLRRSGFYERQNLGMGSFLTPEMMARRNDHSTTDLLRTQPGLDLVQSQPFGASFSVRPRIMSRVGQLYEERARRTWTCLPVIYLDGIVVQSGGEDETYGALLFDLDTVHPRSVIALEVYTSATPARLNVANSHCGVILIWTNAGVPPLL